MNFKGKTLQLYTGIIVRESLEDPSTLKKCTVLTMRMEPDRDNPNNTWHLCTVEASKEKMQEMQKCLKTDSGWYMHFWHGKNVVVVFHDKMFEIVYDDKETWTDAIAHGRSLKIPLEQLDFVIE